MSGAPTLVSVLEIFRLLFSHHWVGQWQGQWHQQGLLRARGGRRTGKPAQATKPPKGKKPKKKKSSGRRFYQRIFSLRVTLWHLIFQRLNFDPTLAAVVTNVRAGGADRLGRWGRKLSRQMRSTQTSGYSQARQRVPVEFLAAALAHLRQGLLQLVGCAAPSQQPPGPGERPRQVLDGSTLAVLFTPSLGRDYPPARNQSGVSDWCLMRIVVGFCARSGAVLSAIEGAIQRSEQALAWELMAQARAFTIWIGDRNFGVWSVVAQAVRYRPDVLVRLRGARAAKLARGRPLRSGEDRALQWSPSRSDQGARGTERAPVAGRLIYVRLKKGGKWIDLWLFTTLDAESYPVALLVTWYGQRWQAELHFRSVKTQMKLAELDVCSAAMARKEFYAGLLAYSLVRAVMWGAGARLEGGLQTLSFSQARRVLLEWLQAWGRRRRGGEGWMESLLAEVAQHRLPKRRRPRPTELRRVRHRRLKFPPLRGDRAAARARELTTQSS